MVYSTSEEESRQDSVDYRQKFGTLQDACPVRAALDIVRGRWKPSILYELKEGPRRYSQLQAALPRISHQALTTQLKQLEADGLVHRDVQAEVPVRVEYSLSPLGSSLADVMDALEAWGEKYLEYRRTHP